MQAATELRIIDSLEGIVPAQWDALAGEQPSLRHSFLHALHETGAATPDTGWTPCYPTLWRDDRLVGAMPLYLKAHSYGEYVFDWAWADAHRRHGLHYYPKLLCAVPFTPVPGPRLLAHEADDRAHLLHAARALMQAEPAVSSLHVLFPAGQDIATLADEGGMRRDGVQFHWHNQGYADFDDFLSRMPHDKRKKIRQDRARASREVEIVALAGGDIGEADWRFFHRCYVETYRAHGASPYLDLAFFQALGRSMPEACVLFLARRAGRAVAASFCLAGGGALYGRYWGAVEFVPALHFELCYYRPIAYCIEQGMMRFEGGAQGEHKLSRGLDPVETHSWHWLKHPDFADAVASFLLRERAGMLEYVDELRERRPFKAKGDEPVGFDEVKNIG
ncbi:GNAT family N-acetyltransferase [Chitinivorax sp. PXF-14]|uniref:GNAT family N-acetyltransferase n=1 Tax=Chitinivorax sp. PXF-14 TaxID=3230488 RepID=UPI003465BFFA